MHILGRLTLVLLLCALVLVIMRPQNTAADDVIRVGDYIKITVIGYTELQRQVQVQEDGTINYPYVEGVPIVGMSTTELQTLLLQILQKYLEDPVVLVELLEKYTITVQVLGQVNKPGMVVIPANLDVQSAISLAGGAMPTADLSQVQVLRPVEGEEDKWQTFDANVQKFIETKDLNILPELTNEDIIIVPAAGTEDYITVVGEVIKPGNYLPFYGANALQVIMMAGGFTDDAQPKKVRVVYNSTKENYTVIKVNLAEIIDEGNFKDVPLVNSGDVIVVPENKSIFKMESLLTLVQQVYMVVALLIIYKRLD